MRQPLGGLPIRYSVLIIVALTVPCGLTHADVVQTIRIGEPLFEPEPQGFAYGSAALSGIPTNASEFWELSDTWDAKTLGENHVLDATSQVVPGKPHNGPYDSELRRAFASQGVIQTDVLLPSERRGANFAAFGFVLVPSADAPLGDSPDGLSVPIIPDHIYPLTQSLSWWKDGEEATAATDVPDFEPLSSVPGFEDLYRSHHVYIGGSGAPASWSDSRLVGDWEYRYEIRDVAGNGWDIIRNVTVVDGPSGVPGDLSHNGELDIHDLNILTQNVVVDAINLKLDMNGDDTVSVADVHYWVTDLKQTYIGDADLNGEFDSGDLVNVFQSGKYDTNDFASWSEGDWNADERFDSIDFVAAFQDGGYELAAPAAIAAVPEPSGWILLTLGALGIYRLRGGKGVRSH